MMRRAGCAEVLIGFESPVREGLDNVELRRNWKLRQQPKYKRAIEVIQAHGIRVNACFVVGLDGHGVEIFDDLFEFVQETLPFDVQVTYPTPFPGTPLYRQLAAQGRLTHAGEWERCTLFDINFRPMKMSGEELRSGFFGLVEKLYSDEFTKYRRDAFKSSRRYRGASIAAA
jgi:radical SAM superfamily enzyme YgiQ (UPF0313 family)